MPRTYQQTKRWGFAALQSEHNMEGAMTLPTSATEVEAVDQ